MKSKVMAAKKAKAIRMGAVESMDIMWRDCQWNNSKGINPIFINHVPDYSIKITHKAKAVACVR